MKLCYICLWRANFALPLNFKETLLYFCIGGFGEVKEVVLMRDKSRVDLLLIVVFILAIVILLVEIKTASIG